MPIHSWHKMWMGVELYMSTFCKANLHKRCLWTWNIHNISKISAKTWVVRFNELLKIKEVIEGRKVSSSWLVGNNYWVKCWRLTWRYHNASTYKGYWKLFHVMNGSHIMFMFVFEKWLNVKKKKLFARIIHVWMCYIAGV